MPTAKRLADYAFKEYPFEIVSGFEQFLFQKHTYTRTHKNRRPAAGFCAVSPREDCPVPTKSGGGSWGDDASIDDGFVLKGLQTFAPINRNFDWTPLNLQVYGKNPALLSNY
jgi:hypothetical protein